MPKPKTVYNFGPQITLKQVINLIFKKKVIEVKCPTMSKTQQNTMGFHLSILVAKVHCSGHMAALLTTEQMVLGQ